MIFRGIKNRVFLQFWILFFLSMLLVDVLLLFIFLERTISQKIDLKMQALRATCEQQRVPIKADGENINKKESPAIFSKDDRFFFVNRLLIEKKIGKGPRLKTELEKMVYQTLQKGTGITKKYGSIVGLFFFQHEFVIITYPVQAEGKTVAAGGIEFPLDEIYQDYNRIQKIAVVFVVINSFFLAFIGNHQLTRIYYRPLKRLAKRAETFRDEDNLFFSVRKEDNEFSVLSSSLNKMLHRITEDKTVLKDTIGSLKNANRELKKAQNDVIRAEKMATVGRLTAGIAHEIGNPIGIVLGYLDLLKQADLSEEERCDFIDRSEKEITRINHIIRQLLDMSRSSAGEAKAVSIHQLLADLVSVFNYQPTASHITFQSFLTAHDDHVFADPDQLRQVFLNILLNAVDAVNTKATGGGCIKVITEQTATITGVSGHPERQVVKVTIEDNGPGIDPAHLPHVFDPFYTTKQPGKGTGLGLSVSFMIVEKLGGHISVDQRQESGAAFQVTLPLTTVDDENNSQ
jgi:two-component system NtrC family sensor kinase